jgi:high-affinity Fe2+/Pb2+ permease
MKNYIKNFKGFILESIESNTKEVQLLDQKKALQEKLKQTEDDIQKTQIESEISKLDIEIEKIRQIEDQEEANEA